VPLTALALRAAFLAALLGQHDYIHIATGCITTRHVQPSPAFHTRTHSPREAERVGQAEVALAEVKGW
jgi:hypothetical protein